MPMHCVSASRQLGLRSFRRSFALAAFRCSSRIRNVGIIAHIDAGKTTTTERFLYYTGATKSIGNVDEGDTITDYLPAERDRGITIQSAAVTVPWNKHSINIIDTPGHADFTFEVIRSLRVLDGAVTILDAVAGVEAQTEKVWKQASALNLPRLVYVNKMDREGNGFSRTCREVIEKLRTRIVLANMPYFVEDKQLRSYTFSGVIDVVSKRLLIWDTTSSANGDRITVVDLEKNSSTYPKEHEELQKARESVIETLGEYNEPLINEFFRCNEDFMAVDGKYIQAAIRESTIKCEVVPVFCGASFKNIGVQPLMDGVVNYLPGPDECGLPEIDFGTAAARDTGLVVNNNSKLSVGLAFKVITDSRKQPLIFIRVYSGRFQQGSVMVNTRTGRRFRATNLLQINGDDTQGIEKLGEGNIGVITSSLLSGSELADDADNEIRTGDTLICHSIKKDGVTGFKKRDLKVAVNPIRVPPLIFTTSLEPRTLKDKKLLDDNLKVLLREDPSLRVSENEQGQTLVSGMGELHLEIIKDRLVDDMKTKCEVSKVMVTYKEGLRGTLGRTEKSADVAGEVFLVEVEIGAKPQDLSCSAEDLFLLDDDNEVLLPRESSPQEVQEYLLGEAEEWPLQMSYESIKNCIVSSSISSLQIGGRIAGLPLHGVRVAIKKWVVPKGSKDAKELLMLVRSAILELLRAVDVGQFEVLEPIMSIRVYTSNEDIGKVTHDLTSGRSGEIISIEDDYVEDKDFRKEAENQYLPTDPLSELAETGSTESSSNKIIIAEAPLREMIGYLSKLRSLTQGRGLFYMDYKGLKVVKKDRVEKIREEL